jgi:hypothetical protein
MFFEGTGVWSLPKRHHGIKSPFLKKGTGRPAFDLDPGGN